MKSYKEMQEALGKAGGKFATRPVASRKGSFNQTTDPIVNAAKDIEDAFTNLKNSIESNNSSFDIQFAKGIVKAMKDVPDAADRLSPQLKKTVASSMKELDAIDKEVTIIEKLTKVLRSRANKVPQIKKNLQDLLKQ